MSEQTLYILYLVSPLALLLCIVICAVASVRVHSVMNKYRRKTLDAGVRGGELARAILDRAGLFDVRVVSGKEGADYYDPKARLVSLSPQNYDGATVTAVAVAAHECGHAVQHAEGYAPARARTALVPVVNVLTRLAMPLILVGVIIEIVMTVLAATGTYAHWGILIAVVGVVFYASVLLFALITLPAEYDASRRGKKILSDGGIVNAQEAVGVRKVLSAAAATYLASALLSLVQLLRIILYLLVIFGGGKKRK
ncbi:MAG: zinc metallopeptidase [Clostridiales bacterium]|jgi:Zn-dependent membrane protease YugP|nr:zinc metallopeptidase [Clostridiales bacterium]